MHNVYATVHANGGVCVILHREYSVDQKQNGKAR